MLISGGDAMNGFADSHEELPHDFCADWRRRAVRKVLQED